MALSKPRGVSSYKIITVNQRIIMRFINLFKKFISNNKKIVITTHIHPDADGIGSEIALCFALKSIGKDVMAVHECPLMDRYKYLDPDNFIISYDEYQKKYANQTIDLLLVVDTNTLTRIGSRMQSLMLNSKNLLFIDHHPAPKEVMAIHCIDPKMAATGELTGKLIESLGIEFTHEIALPLYTAILIDTSSFRYPTVTASTHLLISKLMGTGISSPYAYNQIYGTKSTNYMRMLGTILSQVRSTPDQSIAWIFISQQLLKKYNVDKEDTNSFINHLLILDGMKIAVMFREEGNFMKTSLRSLGDVDVGIMAQALGGGGHNHSAATITEGDSDEIMKSTIEKLKLMLKESLDS